MTLKVIYIASIVCLTLLSIYDFYWGIITFKYRRIAKDKNISFCSYMLELTELDKWKNREDSFVKDYYNGKAYSICYIILSICVLILACLFIIFLIKMSNNELGSQLLNVDLFTK